MPSPTAFRMRLKPGAATEYRVRHDAIWPELTTLLKNAGIANYSIHLDIDGVTLFGVLTIASPERYAALTVDPLMRRWWDYMADLMETDADNRPLAWPLEPAFHLP